MEGSKRPREIRSYEVSCVSHFRGGLLYGDPLIRATAAQHADLLHNNMLCIYRTSAGDPETDIYPALVAHTVPVVAPSSPGRHHLLPAVCATCM